MIDAETVVVVNGLNTHATRLERENEMLLRFCAQRGIKPVRGWDAWWRNCCLASTSARCASRAWWTLPLMMPGGGSRGGGTAPTRASIGCTAAGDVRLGWWRVLAVEAEGRVRSR
jgi:hypothetical protein